MKQVFDCLIEKNLGEKELLSYIKNNYNIEDVFDQSEIRSYVKEKFNLSEVFSDKEIKETFKSLRHLFPINEIYERDEIVSSLNKKLEELADRPRKEGFIGAAF